MRSRSDFDELSLPVFAEAERLSAGVTIDFGAAQVNFYNLL
jgi:hypothetical protein